MFKRIFFLISFLALSLYVRGDVVFYPYQLGLVSYSGDIVYCYEIAKKEKKSSAFVGGVGIVGSFFDLSEPSLGFDIAYERRRYFNSFSFNKFFYSTFIGLAYMTNFKRTHRFGVVPGFKFGYKIDLGRKLTLEPNLGISVPLVLNQEVSDSVIPFPVATIGFKFSVISLKNKIENAL